jgi:hypothetical protein
MRGVLRFLKSALHSAIGLCRRIGSMPTPVEPCQPEWFTTKRRVFQPDGTRALTGCFLVGILL